MQDHYELLGVSRAASLAEIQKAYRKLIGKYHPDRNSSPDAKARSQELNLAWKILGDPIRRKLFDDELKAAAADAQRKSNQEQQERQEQANQRQREWSEQRDRQERANYRAQQQREQQAYQEQQERDRQSRERQEQSNRQREQQAKRQPPKPKPQPPKGANHHYSPPKENYELNGVPALVIFIIGFIILPLIAYGLMGNSEEKPTTIETNTIETIGTPNEGYYKEIEDIPTQGIGPDVVDAPEPVETQSPQPPNGSSCVELWQAYKGKSAPKSFYISRDYRHCAFAFGGTDPDVRAWRRCVERSELGACQLVDKVER